ncbi:cytidylyltransferase domain-containing protein [Paenibacillus protaetiae]|uniref:Acylneuraminate cytidylyltransferase n=1 Tax=Paenibacillus protaetiae TaxID=2509456 RepID=A0A4P6EYG9_9BACL|nr:glycosyltransferase family protein [Paenibacillus protaetiae]QAY67765.1 acylneuraminate cytidylyltransferase [Paenibacillus protaetiae]
MNIVIIQARMGSSRLPGKVLLELEGRTVLQHVVERCRSIQQADQIIVATTVEPADDAIAAECNRLGIPFFRGSEQDVLGRYYHAAVQHEATIVVRVTSDCPLLDPSLCDRVITTLIESGADYCSNDLTRTYPRGLDVEAFTMSALEDAYLNAEEPYFREHVTPYLYEQGAKFKLHSVQHDFDASHYRWTLDTEEDWRFIREVYRLMGDEAGYAWEGAAQLLQHHPELIAINKDVVQKTR